MAAGESKNKLDFTKVGPFLIADASSGRKSIRQLLSQLGTKPQQTDIAESIGDAFEILEKKKCQVIFVDQALVGARLAELVQAQEKALGPGARRAIFLFTGGGSAAEASNAAQEDVDAVIARPFTFQSLHAKVIACLAEKFFPSPHQKLIQDGLAELKAGNLDSAFVLMSKASALSPETPIIYAHLGAILAKQGKVNDAKAVIQQGLKHDPTHFRCLTTLIDVLTEAKDYAAAYDCARTAAKHHPVPMQKLPDLIKLSVMNQKYEDIFEFHKLVEGVSSVDEQTSTYLGAGLVVCGLHYLKQKTPDKAVTVFKKAETIARNNPRILTRMVIALDHPGLESEHAAMLTRMPKEVQDSPEIQVARLGSLRKSDPDAALKLALNLVQESKKDPRVFQAAIELSIECKRSDRSISELIEMAKQNLPELAEKWQSYLKT